MKRFCAATALLASLLGAFSATAQRPLGPDETVPPPGHPPLDDSSAPGMPPGHPPVAAENDSSADDGLPPGHPPVAPETGPATDDELPPGHPNVGAADADTAPSGGERSGPPADSVSPATDLPGGTIEVVVRDGQSRPLPAAPVELVIERHDVAEGDSSERRTGSTNPTGTVLFSGVPWSTSHTYRVSTTRDRGRFVSSEFRLPEGQAQRVVLHAYPTTRDIRQALVGLRGIIVVQPREDVFRVDLTYQVFNVGRVAWVPEGLPIALPSGAHGVRVSDATGDARIERSEGNQVELRGTFGPGQQEVAYGFQLDNDRNDTHAFRIPLPPHVAELRVIAEGGQSVNLDVEGFPEAQRFRGQGGVPLLVAGRQLVRGEAALDAVAFTVSGLPTPGLGRWYAAALAVALVGVGLWSALSSRTGGGATGRISEEDVTQARMMLLDELTLLENLRAREEVGPRMYETMRRTLLDALARLEISTKSGVSATG